MYITEVSFGSPSYDQRCIGFLPAAAVLTRLQVATSIFSSFEKPLQIYLNNKLILFQSKGKPVFFDVIVLLISRLRMLCSWLRLGVIFKLGENVNKRHCPWMKMMYQHLKTCTKCPKRSTPVDTLGPRASKIKDRTKIKRRISGKGYGEK